MKPLTIEEAVSAMGGRTRGSLPAGSVASVCTDSRSIRTGELFFSLKGEQHDGHAFVDACLSAGAMAAVVSDVDRVPAKWRNDGRLISVRDTTEALGKLAAYHRTQCAAQVVAVVGSNGKTTTKELIGASLRVKKTGQVALRSFNNKIGVPLTLLGAEASDEFVVVEIGTNHPGEVAALASLARPDVGVVTSLGEEHLEFLGNLARVADEELSLLQHLRRRGFLAINAECTRYPGAKVRDDLTRLTFGLDAGADLRATGLRAEGTRQLFKVNDRFPYDLPILGAHNVTNALAAIAVGLRFGLTHDEIAAGLAGAKTPPMRLELRRVGGLTILNDAYNANPASMRTALATFEQLLDPGRRVLILGDMRELGAESERCHKELGSAAGRSRAAVIIAIGAMARSVCDGATTSAGAAKRLYGFPSVDVASAELPRIIDANDVILLKGSRAMRLERLVPVLERCVTQMAGA